MNSEPLVVEKGDGVALLRLNRPAVLNAVNRVLLHALIAALEDARRDEAVRCLVIMGSGRAFSAGADLSEMLTMGKAEFRECILLWQRLSLGMREVGKPSLAAVHGYALAGGFELAVVADIRIAAEGAVFGLPDTAIGLPPTSGMTHLLPLIVGMGWAKHLALTGERIDARQAERIGLVTRVVPSAELEAVARAMARATASCAPLGLGYTKQGFDMASDVDLHTALTSEVEREVACFDTDEFRAALRAFADRKKGRPAKGE